ncbi:MAG: branched-chain amino acid aminotransferase [Segetibacter sp.]|jgi:branched-chain amino acid aminotransferase|nr:branched-chain amino acid aminotransferase [Segetibacter sp.]
MVTAPGINVQKVETSKLQSLSLENIPFGKYFTDHMLEADFEDGEWKNIEIKPYQPLLLDPSTAAIHYGQAIFEGIKAYKDGEGNVFMFRPLDNYKRFNISAARMQMPLIPEDVFMEGMRLLVDLDKNWIPGQDDHSLYIRPFMFSTDSVIGVKPSDKYKFMIILSPTGPYYNKPMRIYVEEKYSRAAPGGIGYAKAAGNYGASMLATAEAKKLGYDQVLWTDAVDHKYVQEIGTMNVFFIIGNKAYTPELLSGAILAGVTRDSAITILQEMGLEVLEERINIDDIINAHRSGLLYEVFGTGTAATISLIRELRYKDYIMEFAVESWKVAPELKKRLNDIRNCKVPDRFNWMYKI